jgi:hypothetical protein
MNTTAVLRFLALGHHLERDPVDLLNQFTIGKKPDNMF